MLSVLLGTFIVCTIFLFKSVWRLWFTTRISTATSLNHDLHVKSEIFVTCSGGHVCFLPDLFLVQFIHFVVVCCKTVQVRWLLQFSGKIHTGILCKMYTFVGSLVCSCPTNVLLPIICKEAVGNCYQTHRCWKCWLHSRDITLFEWFWWYLWPTMVSKMSEEFPTVTLDITACTWPPFLFLFF